MTLDEKGDVGFLEDCLTILLNLVHVEEHCANSFFMSHDENWLKLGEEARKDRTLLLDLVTLHDDKSQIWCFNKHCLVTVLGYRELANRMMSINNIERAKFYSNLSAKWLEFFYSKNKIGEVK